MSTVILIFLTLMIANAVILGMKGKWWSVFLWSGGIVGIIMAIRVAKPRSYWDRKWSTPEQQRIARQRFSKRRGSDRFPIEQA